jgi:hypothetical protein
MMFKFKVDCMLGGWQQDAFYLFLPGNLVNLSNILVGDSVREAAISGLYTPDGQSDPGISAWAHDSEHANPSCASPRMSGTSQQLCRDAIRGQLRASQYWLTCLFSTTFLDLNRLAFIVIIGSKVQVEMGSNHLDSGEVMDWGHSGQHPVLVCR